MQNNNSLKILFTGLTLTSSWCNRHASTYKSLLKSLAKMGHEVTFLERVNPNFFHTRENILPDFCKIDFYENVRDFKSKYLHEVKNSDVIVLGSNVIDGSEIGEFLFEKGKGVKIFYDLDAPVTFEKLEEGDYQFINKELIRQVDLYLSFSGGPFLDKIKENFNPSAIKSLFCSVDTDFYKPKEMKHKWHLGYLGAYCKDKQQQLEDLMLETAILFPEGKFVVAGPLFPTSFVWGNNIQRIEFVPLSKQPDFYNLQKFTLNITRSSMTKVGYTPSVRIFEAAACGIPIISDYWEGIDDFLEIDEEILISRSFKDTLYYLKNISENEYKLLSEKSRQKMVDYHSSDKRAGEFISYLEEIMHKMPVLPHV